MTVGADLRWIASWHARRLAPQCGCRRL